MNRRDVLRGVVGYAAAPSLPCVPATRADARVIAPLSLKEIASARPFKPIESEVSLLEEIQFGAAKYFYERADKSTGLNYDRSRSTGESSPNNHSASTAASGFALSAFTVAAERGYLSPGKCEQRMLLILDFYANHIEHEHGFFYHYTDVANGHRIDKTELSSIDTALFLCGVLHASQYLNSAAADALARQIYHRVDWEWMLNHRNTLAMGWTPEEGFLSVHWDSYCESTIMYLLAIGSPTHPIPATSWRNVKRDQIDYGGIRFITSYGALFIHQYSHIWCDFRGVRDSYANYFENSVAATRAHKTFCVKYNGSFPWIDESVWGFSASDSPSGIYTVWAGPPMMNFPNGTLAPHAAGGSLPFLGNECLTVLKQMREIHPLCWTRYGFVDAFHPGVGWYDPDVIAIDLGLIMLMAENLRSGSIWSLFMRNREITGAMRAVGFQTDSTKHGAAESDIQCSSGKF
jgi:hypothetical protein